MKVQALIVALAVLTLAAPEARAAAPVPLVRATHTVVATLTSPPGSSPAGLAFATRSGLLFVANIFTDDVSVIDPRTRAVIDTVKLAGGNTCAHPLSVGYDKAHDVIYVSCQQYVDVTAIDGTTHQPIGSPIEVGSSPFGIAYNERNGDVYIVIAHTPRDGDLYVATLGAGTVDVIDTTMNVLVESVPLGSGGVWTATDPRTGDVWVTHGDAVSELAARQGPPLMQISPAMVNFGAQPVGSVESKFVTVTNASGRPLLVAVTTVHVPDDFSAGGGLPGSTCPSPDQGLLGAGESCTQFVGFFPSEPFLGQHETGYLQVTAYDPLSGENLEEDFVALKGIPR